jgi:1-acyl-sn-glycerol-3-phosphate acyltransferase
MADFDYKKFSELKKLSLDELSSYYRQLRSFEYDNNKPLESSELKKKIYFLTKLILKIDRITSGRKLIVFDDKRSKNCDKGKVYASTHVGRYDIESAMEAINEQLYFVMGDPEETYRNIEGFFLDNIQGRICLDTGYQIADIFKKKINGEELSLEEQALYDEYKKDRFIGEDTCTKRVLNKDNILIFPEGAWNVTPRIVQPIFDGAARIAINGNGFIVPIGIVRDNKKYVVNIGSEMNIDGATVSDTKDITKELREKMCSLVGEIVFDDKVNSRAEMGTPEENELAFINDIMRESENGYTLDVIENTRYYDKNAPENVFKLVRKGL